MKYPLLAVAALCSGCASGVFDSKQPVQQTYQLAAGAPEAAAGGRLDIDLAVARPIVTPGLFTERIAASHADRRLDYFSGSRWGSTADLVVQSLLVQSLRNSGRLATVHNDLSPFTAQYLLQAELHDFQAEYADGSAPPRVRVGLVCTLGRIRAREPLAEYVAGAEVAAADNTMRAVVAAFEQAYREAARTVVAETLKTLESAQATRAQAGK